MKDISEFCEMTENKTATKINANTIGLEVLNNDIKDTLKINSENRKRILKNSKRKNFNYLKYHNTSYPAQKANQIEFPVLYNNTNTTRHNKSCEENYHLPTNNTHSNPWNSLFKKQVKPMSIVNRYTLSTIHKQQG